MAAGPRPRVWRLTADSEAAAGPRRRQAVVGGRLVPHTGFEPVISALRGRCPGPLDECGARRSGDADQAGGYQEPHHQGKPAALAAERAQRAAHRRRRAPPAVTTPGPLRRSSAASRSSTRHKTADRERVGIPHHLLVRRVRDHEPGPLAPLPRLALIARVGEHVRAPAHRRAGSGRQPAAVARRAVEALAVAARRPGPRPQARDAQRRFASRNPRSVSATCRKLCSPSTSP
jgi:hypothetical protein